MPDLPTIALRAVDAGDLPMLLAHRNLESTRRWLEHDASVTEAQQRVWYRNGGADVIRIIECAGKSVGFGRLDAGPSQEVHVGLDIFFAYQGRGLAAPCFREVCMAAATFGRRLALWVFLENKRAVSIYRKSGFVEDVGSSIRWLPRPLVAGNANNEFAYVKMVREP